MGNTNQNQARIDEIINELEGYTPYTNNMFNELCICLEKSVHDLKNSFNNFVFCIDFSFLYDIKERLTLYDIYYKTEEKSFKQAYFALKKIAVQGDISDIKLSYDRIIGKLRVGLKNFAVDDVYIKKGLYEFISHFINKLVNVDYEVTDFIKPYLCPESIKNRFEIDIYEKFIKACKCAQCFNTKYKDQFSKTNLKVSSTFFLHVLLRHYGPLKVMTQYHKNPIYKSKIKNGLGIPVDITAFTNSDNSVSVISSDGEFPTTKVLNKQNYLANDLCKIVDILKEVLPILSSKINEERSPNIIYYKNQLYGLEFEKFRYKKEGLIVVDSFYPLNSEWQMRNGISKEDYNYIINLKEVPSDLNIKIEE